LKARWTNIDLQRSTWTIPATDTKNKLEHVLPLSSQAVEILTDIHMLTGRSEYVFESQKIANQPYNGVQVAIYRVQKLSGVADFRLHDLRRTAATYMAKLGVDRTVLGKVLNHKGIAQDHSVTAIYDPEPIFRRSSESTSALGLQAGRYCNGAKRRRANY
jgi:integrase